MIINLLSGPRNISTTLMYSFAQRSDMGVMDEPFYAYHLKHHNIDHPGKEATLAAMPSEASAVFEEILDKAELDEHLFLKNMPHHMEGVDPTLMLDCKHLLLIRDPSRMVASFTKVVDNPTAKDFALEDQWRWYSMLLAQGEAPVVVNANTILENPKEALSVICKRLGIEFEEAMLSWPQGPKAEDGPWAAYWYENVHKSTGFGKPKVGSVEVSEPFQDLYHSILPFYERLNEVAIKT